MWHSVLGPICKLRRKWSVANTTLGVWDTFTRWDSTQGILSGFQSSWIILIGCWNQIIVSIGTIRKWYTKYNYKWLIITQFSTIVQKHVIMRLKWKNLRSAQDDWHPVWFYWFTLLKIRRCPFTLMAISISNQHSFSHSLNPLFSLSLSLFLRSFPTMFSPVVFPHKYSNNLINGIIK